jgi:hypothetical protein
VLVVAFQEGEQGEARVTEPITFFMRRDGTIASFLEAVFTGRRADAGTGRDRRRISVGGRGGCTSAGVHRRTGVADYSTVGSTRGMRAGPREAHVRSLLVLFALAGGVLLAACGGDKQTAEPTERPRATATAVEPEPTERAAREVGDGVGRGTVGSVFSTLFKAGTGGPGTSTLGLGQGDESLKAYLPDASDFPDGYTPLGSSTFSAPADASDLGAIDMAVTLAVKGDPGTFTSGDPSDVDLSSIEMVIAAVIKPEDLQALGDAMGSLEGLSAEDIQDQMDAAFGELEGFKLQRLEMLDASGLGDGGFGMELTIDVSGLTSLAGAFGAGEDVPQFSSMTMRIYVFGRGDYAGAVMRFAFSDSLPGDSLDIDLARIVDEKLSTAP